MAARLEHSQHEESPTASHDQVKDCSKIKLHYMYMLFEMYFRIQRYILIHAVIAFLENTA
jgi:hypothetical protein